jgi:2-keto-4-pentenoate hydratase/2-oxohepta-3-ene-1,7-dioic acid hydratase in catechol pathway
MSCRASSIEGNCARAKDQVMTLWVRFKSTDGHVGFGVLESDQILEYAGDIFGEHSATGKLLTTSAVRLLCPCAPSKIIALWNNFHALAVKLGKTAPKYPLFLIKPASCVAGPLDVIARPVAYKGKIAYEGELGIVIGKRCANVSVAAAAGYILGYTCVNDVTASELLNEDANFAQWCRAKGFDTFGCVGPAIACGLDWSTLSVVTKVGGIERQNYPLSDMIFSPHELVSHLSHDMTLLPGDVIACGTSLGIGSIKDGATVEIDIAGIGSLVNSLSLPNIQR